MHLAEPKKPRALPNETQAWNDHLERMAAMGKLNPDDCSPYRRSMSPPPSRFRARSASPVRARSAEPCERASSALMRASSPFLSREPSPSTYYRGASPSPVVGYTYSGTHSSALHLVHIGLLNDSIVWLYYTNSSTNLLCIFSGMILSIIRD
jgi:hypothetical protein